MVLEIARLSIKPGKTEEFKQAIPRAVAIISQAAGLININFKRSVENPTTFVALIEWETVEDHTIAFRESEHFMRWREVISPFFDSKPEVEHFTAI